MDKVVQLVSVMADGEHKVLALTATGSIFERIRDPRSVNMGEPGRGTKYLWRPVPGPLDE